MLFSGGIPVLLGGTKVALHVCTRVIFASFARYRMVIRIPKSYL